MSQKISRIEYAQLRCMLKGTEELFHAFDEYSKQAASLQVRDEFQKLAAEAKNQQNDILSYLEGSRIR
ncbi:MAG: hypothetical protein ACI4JW_03030 [Oscillospiraceae bacterium]